MNVSNHSAEETLRGSNPRDQRVSARILLVPLHFYRRFISPLIAPRCRYYPTCSTYALEAIRTYGPIRGFALAAWRLLRCNPFSNGGVDHVCDQSLFKRRGELIPNRHEGCVLNTEDRAAA